MKLTDAVITRRRNEDVELLDWPGAKLKLTNGQSPKFLYRVVDPAEWEQAKEMGKLSPSKFYDRIHASIKPEKNYGMQGHIVLRINYDPSDEWKTKSNLDGDVFAVTYNSISLAKIKEVGKL